MSEALSLSVTFGAAPGPEDRPFAVPTRRQTTTPGLVIVKTHYDRFEVWHAESGLPGARWVRLQRDAIAIANHLGTYTVDYTQPGSTIGKEWDAQVVGERFAVARWLKSWEHIGEQFPAKPTAPPEGKPRRLIATLCHFCDGDGRGEHGPYRNQCMRCWDAYAVLKQRGWCMQDSDLLPTLVARPDQWRELTDRERTAWKRWTSSAAYRNAN